MAKQHKKFEDSHTSDYAQSQAHTPEEGTSNIIEASKSFLKRSSNQLGRKQYWRRATKSVKNFVHKPATQRFIKKTKQNTRYTWLITKRRTKNLFRRLKHFTHVKTTPGNAKGVYEKSNAQLEAKLKLLTQENKHLKAENKTLSKQAKIIIQALKELEKQEF